MACPNRRRLRRSGPENAPGSSLPTAAVRSNNNGKGAGRSLFRRIGAVSGGAAADRPPGVGKATVRLFSLKAYCRNGSWEKLILSTAPIQYHHYFIKTINTFNSSAYSSTQTNAFV